MSGKTEDMSIPVCCCLDCLHATYICEGDSVCGESDGFDLVLENWEPAEGFRVNCLMWEAQ